jgi:heme oxygenase
MSQHELAARLREATLALHRTAESSGVMKRLLQGRLQRHTYCRLLRNLHALYSALEAALDQHAALAAISTMRLPALFRATVLGKDLDYLHGAGWDLLPLTKSMHEYVTRIHELAAGRPVLLVAHAYVRYMGDLSGGQILRNIVLRSLGLDAESGTAFYVFGDSGEIDTMKARFRSALNALVLDAVDEEQIIGEANAAFAFHVRLFADLDRAV